ILFLSGIRGEDVRTVTGYLGESVDLRADADPSWNLNEISWSIYENDTSIAISQSNKKNVDRFYLFTGRLELNTTSGDLTIKNLSFIHALKYTVELIGKGPSQRRTRYFDLSVQVRLIKPSIRLRHSILDSGYCVISLGCVSTNNTVSLSWESKPGFNEPFWSGQQGQAGESVLWTAFTPNRVVTFTCIAVGGSQRELREKNVTC
ncbi:SLAM family member 5-like, partial [Silurus meridionalis]